MTQWILPAGAQVRNVPDLQDWRHVPSSIGLVESPHPFIRSGAQPEVNLIGWRHHLSQRLLRHEGIQYHLRAAVLLLLGAAMVLWGTSSTVAAFMSAGEQSNTGDEEVPVEGFLPYSVPMETQAARISGMDQAGAFGAANPWLDDDVRAALQPMLDETLFPPETPIRLYIESIGLNAPVVGAKLRKVWLAGSQYEQWLAPDEFAVGWHTSSARLGERSNTVLNGHHNVHGEVFRRLEEVRVGDVVVVSGRENVYRFMVVNRIIVPEKKLGSDGRLENARWISHTQDQRLTLVTCWPYESNTHRLILVARRIR